MWELTGEKLCFNGEVILCGCTDIKDYFCDEHGGAFITVSSNTAAEENAYNIGKVQGAKKYMSCFRSNCAFMDADCGDDISKLHTETLCLLIQRCNGRYLLLLPIYDKKSRGALQSGEKGLEVVGVTGCEDIAVSEGELLYIIEGDNPYDMMQTAAVSLKDRLKGFKLREEKKLPSFINTLGWCTWNAFYFDIDGEKLLGGLKEFKENGINLGFVLMDDGWLSTTDSMPIGSRRLTDFAENRLKFPDGLKGLTARAKNEYGVKQFMVWHASMGYWAGVKMKGYTNNSAADIKYPSCLSGDALSFNRQFKHYPILSDKADEFFNKWHKYLKSVGVDGVKIDVQYLIEGLAHKAGGRIRSMNIYRRAIEDSVSANFDNNCLNCMSCSNDMLYRMDKTNILRSGEDWATEHKNYKNIVTNAFNTYWIHPIAFADWDMFWSNREESLIEAIARIAGGSPIYVSDKPFGHNFELMRSLCLDDGTLLRPLEPGRPTLDCLMRNPIREHGAFKIFNRNTQSGIIGAFNIFGEETADYTISPSDINGISGENFIIFGYTDGKIYKAKAEEKIPLTLKPLSADLYTVSRVVGGAAVMGLCGKINSSAAVNTFGYRDGILQAEVKANGSYRFYCESKPKKVLFNGNDCTFDYRDCVVTAVLQ